MTADVRGSESWAKLRLRLFSRHRDGAAPHLFGGFVHGAHLQNPEGPNEFFSLREGAIHHSALVAGKAYPVGKPRN